MGKLNLIVVRNKNGKIIEINTDMICFIERDEVAKTFCICFGQGYVEVTGEEWGRVRKLL
jgi:hypothetical protein